MRSGVPLSWVQKSANKSSPKRNSALDVLRGIAVLMVIFSHVYLPDKTAVQHSIFKYIRLFFSLLTIGGWSGVDLFFVLSGFLVSGLLFNEYKKSHAIRPGRFLIRRGFKIYPGFIFFIVITFLIETFGQNMLGARFPISDYIKDLFFLHNYFGGRWTHTWSLDVEEAFYFLLTAMFVILVRSKQLNLKVIINTYILLLIAGIIGRLIANYTHPEYNFDYHFFYTHFRLDALFFGVLLSYLYHFQKEQFLSFYSNNKKIIAVLVALLLIPNFLFHRTDNSWISVVLLATNPLAYGSWIILAINSKLRFYDNSILSFIGRSSYAIYLWHPFVDIYANHYLNTSKTGFLIYIATYLIFSIIIGYIVTKLLEDPLLKMRDKIYPSQNKTILVPAR